VRPHRGLPALQPGRPDAVVNNLNPKHRRRAYLAIAMERESFIRNFACGETREAGPREVQACCCDQVLKFISRTVVYI